jgi:hypothetical protein
MSYQARGWVIERSQHSGLRLFVFYMLADEMNARGEGSYAAVSHLARVVRLSRQRVQRLLHDLEASKELECVTRGTGRTNTVWRIPGVVRDGYYAESRGNPVLPLPQPSVAPAATQSCPRGNPVLPNPSTGGTYSKSIKPTPPPPPAAAVLADPPTELLQGLKSYWEECDRYGQKAVWMDELAVGRLWAACRAAMPECTPEDVVRAVIYKGHSTKGARNPVGVLIATVPAILQAWGRVAVP